MSIKRDSVYMLIPQVDMTTPMINRSISKNTSQMPEFTEDSTDYYVVEVLNSTIELTTIFDGYTWYTRKEMEDKING